MVIGDRVKFSGDAKWWTVRATDGERFVILTRQADFKPKGHALYTIIDWHRGLRGPCDLIGGGWDEQMGDSACLRLMDALAAGDVEVSYRNNLPIDISAMVTA